MCSLLLGKRQAVPETGPREAGVLIKFNSMQYLDRGGAETTARSPHSFCTKARTPPLSKALLLKAPFVHLDQKTKELVVSTYTCFRLECLKLFFTSPFHPLHYVPRYVGTENRSTNQTFTGNKSLRILFLKKY